MMQGGDLHLARVLHGERLVEVRTTRRRRLPLFVTRVGGRHGGDV